MILVDNQPVLNLPHDDERRKYYEEETKKIKAKKEDIIFKRTTYFKLSNGKRRKPPVEAIQSFSELNSDRGIEVWGCCRTYSKDPKTERMALKPNMYYFNKAKHLLNPQRDFELIFYLTCVVGLSRLGYTIENPELEAKELNDKEIAELDVQYAIKRKLDDEDLRYYAKAWGISYADKVGIEQLRRTLFDTVKKSQENYETTRKGYKEFMDDIFNKSPEVMEARATVNMAFDKGYLAINNLTRKVMYTPAKHAVCVVPVEEKERVSDYVAELLLREKNAELYETLKLDVYGQPPEFTISIAEVDKLTTRDQLKEVAQKLGVTFPGVAKDETIRAKIIEKIQSN